MVVFRREDNTDKLIFIRIIAFAFMLLFVLLAIDNLKVVKYRAVHGVRQIETEIVNRAKREKKKESEQISTKAMNVSMILTGISYATNWRPIETKLKHEY